MVRIPSALRYSPASILIRSARPEYGNVVAFVVAHAVNPQFVALEVQSPRPIASGSNGRLVPAAGPRAALRVFRAYRPRPQARGGLQSTGELRWGGPTRGVPPLAPRVLRGARDRPAPSGTFPAHERRPPPRAPQWRPDHGRVSAGPIGEGTPSFRVVHSLGLHRHHDRRADASARSRCL